jgi:hypothetical protein
VLPLHVLQRDGLETEIQRAVFRGVAHQPVFDLDRMPAMAGICGLATASGTARCADLRPYRLRRKEEATGRIVEDLSESTSWCTMSLKERPGGHLLVRVRRLLDCPVNPSESTP